jgi:N-acetylmuramoyl-L-alanine amidase
MKVEWLVVHHSASDRATTTKEDIEKWHRDRGFSQIGYHKVIEGDGAIKDGRPESIAGAHAKGANNESLGVCVCGNFEEETPMAAQVDALKQVLTQWCKDHSLDESSIYGHFNVPGGETATACPGKNMKAILGSIKTAVRERLSP